MVLRVLTIDPTRQVAGAVRPLRGTRWFARPLRPLVAARTARSRQETCHFTLRAPFAVVCCASADCGTNARSGPCHLATPSTDQDPSSASIIRLRPLAEIGTHGGSTSPKTMRGSGPWRTSSCDTKARRHGGTSRLAKTSKITLHGQSSICVAEPPALLAGRTSRVALMATGNPLHVYSAPKRCLSDTLGVWALSFICVLHVP